MRKYLGSRIPVIIKVFTYCTLMSSGILKVMPAFSQTTQNTQNTTFSTKPRYELKLNLNEYSVLNSALVDGLDKFGGLVEFNLKMTKEENQIRWTITTEKLKLLETLNYLLSLKTVEFVKRVNFDDLDTNSKIAFKTTKSLAKKLEYVQKNPIWDLEKVSGTIKHELKNWYINSAHGRYKIKGENVSEIAKFQERRIIIHGYIKTADEIEVVRIQEIKENTLELFVMSKCPFGREAEISLLNFLEKFYGKNKPSLEIRYIFYRHTSGNKTVYTSLHGEEEVNENLIQIVIRDKYFQFFYDYLKRRASSNAPWYELATDIGLKENDIQTIRNFKANEGDYLIQKEYDYATNTYQIYDGSPTYVWESEKQQNIRDIEIFKDVKSTSEGCSN